MTPPPRDAPDRPDQPPSRAPALRAQLVNGQGSGPRGSPDGPGPAPPRGALRPLPGPQGTVRLGSSLAGTAASALKGRAGGRGVVTHLKERHALPFKGSLSVHVHAADERAVLPGVSISCGEGLGQM